jgi:preprotein translocase subunit SecG
MVALLLIGIVLIQQSKDGGFGGGSTFGGLGESIFGGQASDHLTKVTVVLASMFLGLTLLLAVITGRRPMDKGIVEGQLEETTEMSPVKAPETKKQALKQDKAILDSMDKVLEADESKGADAKTVDKAVSTDAGQAATKSEATKKKTIAKDKGKDAKAKAPAPK